jgi:putative transposase
MAAMVRAELVLTALDMAIKRRRPAPGLIHHRSRQPVHEPHLRASAARSEDPPLDGDLGDAYDNAMAEIFFASLETELIDRSVWRTHDEARSAVFDYMEIFYNRARPHCAPGHVSLDQFEAGTVSARRARSRPLANS